MLYEAKRAGKNLVRISQLEDKVQAV